MVPKCVQISQKKCSICGESRNDAVGAEKRDGMSEWRGREKGEMGRIVKVVMKCLLENQTEISLIGTSIVSAKGNWCLWVDSSSHFMNSIGFVCENNSATVHYYYNVATTASLLAFISYYVLLLLPHLLHEPLFLHLFTIWAQLFAYSNCYCHTIGVDPERN